jgi:RNA polymerase sigma-70 factor (ECF subfamily)
MAARTTGTAPGDEQLAARVARREGSEPERRAAREAFERLYGRHAPMLLAFLGARVSPRADADDLHQEVWQRVWRHLPCSFLGGNFRAWLFQVARNALTDHVRKRRPEPLGGKESALVDPGDPPDAGLIERERAEALRRCLERLGDPAAALVRARLGGARYEEIGPGLGLDPARAHRLFYKAKERLKNCVERALACD